MKKKKAVTRPKAKPVKPKKKTLSVRVNELERAVSKIQDDTSEFGNHRILGVLADAGIRGSNAGTGLRRIITDLAKDGRPLAERLQELADGGLTFGGANDKWEIDSAIEKRFNDLFKELLYVKKSLEDQIRVIKRQN